MIAFFYPGAAKTVFQNALLILPPAFLYSMKSDLPHIFLLTAAILLIRLFRRKHLPYGDRPIIYCITAALVLTVLPDLLVSTDETRFGLFDIMLRSSLAVPFLLYTAALGCLFPPDPVRLALTAAPALAATLICGDMFNSSNLSNTLLPFLDVPLRHYRTTYAIAATVQAASLPLFFYSSSRFLQPVGSRRSTAAGRGIIRALCILLIPVLAFSIAKLYYANTGLFRNLELYFLRAGMRRHLTRQGMMILSNSVDLNATLRPELRQNPDNVLIRARTDTPPGYLRGGVYTVYHHGRWIADNDKTVLPATRRTTILSDNTFLLTDFPGGLSTVPDDPRTPPPFPAKRVDLYFDGLLTRGIIPAPGNTYRLDAVADGAEVSGNGIFSLNSWKRDGGCTYFVTRYDPRAAWPFPTDPEALSKLSAVPRELQEPLRKLAATILEGKTIRNDADKLAAVIRWLQTGFRYSLDFRPPPDGTDPVLHFLTRAGYGHCELFASSAVLLLRSMGFPARYVTGFICGEHNPLLRAYIARAANAHAWAEVYLPGEKRWILAEATPPSGDLPSAHSHTERSAGRSLYDALKGLMQLAFAAIRRGYFADAVLSGLNSVFLFLWTVCRRLEISIPLAVLTFLLIRRFRRTPRRTEFGIPDRQRKKLRSLLAEFERSYSRQTRRKRPQEETLTAFYADVPEEIRLLIRDYEALRYRAEAPDDPELQTLRRRFRAVRNKGAMPPAGK